MPNTFRPSSTDLTVRALQQGGKALPLRGLAVPPTNVECRVQGGAHADGRLLPGVDGQAGPQRARARGAEGGGQGVPRRQGLAAGRRVRRGRERAQGGPAGAGQGARGVPPLPGTLVIAKLDRLSRDASFLLSLRDAGVEFVACDMPEANRLTVGIMALMAEHEAEMVSKRTRDALVAAKARGQRLGGFRGHVPSETNRAQAARARAAVSRERAVQVLPVIRGIRAAGTTSLSGVARELTQRGVPTPRGAGEWQAVQVQRVLRAARRDTDLSCP